MNHFQSLLMNVHAKDIEIFWCTQWDLWSVWLSCIWPFLEYACPSWSSSLTCWAINAMEQVQKHALCLILGHKYETDKKAMLTLSIPSLQKKTVIISHDCAPEFGMLNAIYLFLEVINTICDCSFLVQMHKFGIIEHLLCVFIDNIGPSHTS